MPLPKLASNLFNVDDVKLFDHFLSKMELLRKTTNFNADGGTLDNNNFIEIREPIEPTLIRRKKNWLSCSGRTMKKTFLNYFD